MVWLNHLLKLLVPTVRTWMMLQALFAGFVCKHLMRVVLRQLIIQIITLAHIILNILHIWFSSILSTSDFWQLECGLTGVSHKTDLMRSILASQMWLVTLLINWLSISAIKVGTTLTYHASRPGVVWKLFLTGLSIQILEMLLSILCNYSTFFLSNALTVNILNLTILALHNNFGASLPRWHLSSSRLHSMYLIILLRWRLVIASSYEWHLDSIPLKDAMVIIIASNA